MAPISLTLLLAVGVTLVQVFAEEPEKIVGGRNAAPGQFPYQVSLRVNNEHFCGGTLIDATHVVTAAHCIDGIIAPPYDDFVVVTGTISLSSGGQEYSVSQVFTHPHYKNTARESFRNDVAVIVLAQEVETNVFQSPIPLASVSPPVGSVLTLSGWGRTAVAGGLSDILQTTTTTLLGNRRCESLANGMHIYDGQMCTLKQEGIGACQGDSGGPLVYNNQLVGIVSWVFSCALGLPDAYTRVPAYLDFINEIVAKT